MPLGEIWFVLDSGVAYLPDGTRTSLTGGVSGRRTPSRVRLIDCQEKLLSSSLVKMLTALLSLPSRSTAEASMTHFEPSRVHASSPKPPCASKCHETTFP